MADPVVPHFQNDAGAEKIRIGVREFKCTGATPPHDHPHVYLDMGDEDQIVCPYCSTVFIHDAALDPRASEPPDCLYREEAAA